MYNLVHPMWVLFRQGSGDPWALGPPHTATLPGALTAHRS
jgi:hypothetical protein